MSINAPIKTTRRSLALCIKYMLATRWRTIRKGRKEKLLCSQKIRKTIEKMTKENKRALNTTEKK